ncbi:MAG: phage major capsid protein, partial [Actinobacteria bacterium]|nr:phage major capsid protein [Actinomycetota bacterium]
KREIANDVEADQVRAAKALIDSIDQDITERRARLDELKAEKASNEAAQALAREFGAGTQDRSLPGLSVTEPRTYTPETSREGVSFFRDAYLSKETDNWSSRERLQRHAREVEVHKELTTRAQTTGGGAGLVIPQYLVELTALVARAGRPFANAVGTKLELPDTGMSIIIPRGTTGAAVASQATENSAVQNTDEVWANLTVPIVTIAGQQDVSRQFLERGAAGIDLLVYGDLAGAYAAELDRQAVNGSGASNQMLGALQTAGVNQATAFGAAATAATFMTKWAGAKAGIAANRFAGANLAACHPNRWGWVEQLVDSQGRVLAVPNQNGPVNTFGVYEDSTYGTVVGTLTTVPVITDANIPTAVGTGPEDQVLVVRKEDLILWEDGDGMPRQLRFEQTLGNQLTTKLVVYGYAAFTAGRYPKAVSIIGGNAGTAGFGLVAPTF